MLLLYVDIMACHDEVTGSCHLCVVKFPNKETTKFIVDCGLFQEEKYTKYNESFPFNPDSLDFCLITHNHVDHTGRIPMLVKNGFNGKIYATKQTQAIMPIALNDSVKVLSDVYKRKHQKPLYTETDVEKTIEMIEGLEYDKKYNISENISVTFLSNGHLVGAAMILVQITYPGEEDINLLFTGDYNCKNEFVDLKPLPDYVKDLRLTVICESTYGDMSARDINYGYFQKTVMEEIQNSKTIIVPVFSLGRSQEILYKLKKMQEEGLISVDIPIYFDGKLAHAYTGMYLKCEGLIKEEMRDFLPKNLTYVDCTTRESLLNCDHCKIIVTTSGMGTYGPAQVYIPYFITESKALILFTGYTAEGSLGANIRNAEVGDFVKIGGMIKRKKCSISYCNEFSGHAKMEELLGLLHEFKNLRAVLLNHGEERSKQFFAERIYDEIEVKDVGILNREFFFRIGSFGVEKTLSTKFKF